MDDGEAIRAGRLVNNPRVFGDALAETGSRNAVSNGWNADRISVGFSEYPFQIRGGQSADANNGAAAGTYTAAGSRGQAANISSHRTILLGY
ncbi:hypothetical protein FWG76_00765 [Candidatus Saccharibacteria bacterium]|nr:hypothetical protein [Candidatus Saccharibacteria bacterium]